MMDIDLFITAVFFFVDNFCKEHPLKPRPGPEWKLNASEAITLLLFSQWGRFSCERDFYQALEKLEQRDAEKFFLSRFADTQLRYAFPDLPSREQLNRQWHSLHDQV